MNEIFLERIKEYFGGESDDFLKELKNPCTQGFFANTKKESKDKIFDLINFPFQPCIYNDVSFYHNHNNIGKTKAYELGLIYPQEIAASLSTSYIDTKDVKVVVDMCSSPGGKSINLINRLGDDVVFICNEYNYTRCGVLSSNLERLGLDNVIITNKNCNELSNQLKCKADVVILDAPCSGEGMIRKYPEILDNYSLDNISSLSNLQAELLEDAYQLLNNNGQLLYSTCTYAFEEDEMQISNFINKHPDMEIVCLNIDTNYSKLKGTIKLCPLNNTEGQFICLLRKHSDCSCLNKIKMLKSIDNPIIDCFIKDNFNIDHYYLYKNNERYYLSFIELFNLEHNVFRYGIYVGENVNNRFVPSHNLYRSNLLKNKYKYTYDLNDVEYENFVKGLEIKKDIHDHYYLLTYNNVSLGYGKCSKGIIKNKYPKGLRK